MIEVSLTRRRWDISAGGELSQKGGGTLVPGVCLPSSSKTEKLRLFEKANLYLTYRLILTS